MSSYSDHSDRQPPANPAREPTSGPDQADRLPRVQFPQTDFQALEPRDIALIQRLYPEAEKVLIEREFKGGYGEARVLLVQPVRRGGDPMARQIIKISEEPELAYEHDNFGQYVDKDLPLIAARVDQYAEFEGLAGITYSFVGDGMLGQPRTLVAYYEDPQVSNPAFIQTLTELLDEALGQQWYRHNRTHICFFYEEYGRHLAELLRLQLRPASQDGIWPAAEAPNFMPVYTRVSEEMIVAMHQDISPGTLVHLEGLVVSKVKRHELKLHYPTNPGLVVKVAGQPAGNWPLGDPVVVRGEVIYNRQGRLEDVVSQAFAKFPEVVVDVKQPELAWGEPSTPYPNPLHLYPKILDQTLHGNKSMVHGDLHLRNVLVDQKGRGWLIDFARVMERHNLYDFIKMETYLRQMVLNQEAKYQFSFALYLQFEEALVAASLGRPASPPNHPDLQKAYQVIQSLREMAGHYMDHPVDFQQEYFPALFLYNLAVLKYRENHGDQAVRLSFATAAVVGRALTQAPPPPAKQKIEIILKGDFSTLSEDTRSAAIQSLAAIMGITIREIEMYSVVAGSIIYRLGVPAKGVEQLRAQLTANNAKLRLLKIEKVILPAESGETEEWVAKEGKFELVTSTSIFRSLTMKSIQYIETAKLFADAITAARTWEGMMGEGRKGRAERAFEALRNGKIKLDNPQAFIQRLRPKDFEKHGLQLSPDIEKGMQGKDGYAFYLVAIPVLLFPGRGAQYRLLESQFTFDVKGNKRPLGIQNIFPKSFWKPVLDWGGSLNLALDSSLEWGAEVEQTEAKIAKLGGQLAGRVNNLNQLTGFITVIPFKHTLGRMEIEAQYASSTAMWRFDSKKVIRGQKHTQFVILLKVPKEVNQVRLQAVVQAEVSFDWLAAQIEHVFERLPQTIQEIVKNEEGLPLQDFQTWTLDLPK